MHTRHWLKICIFALTLHARNVAISAKPEEKVLYDNTPGVQKNAIFLFCIFSWGSKKIKLKINIDVDTHHDFDCIRLANRRNTLLFVCRVLRQFLHTAAPSHRQVSSRGADLSPPAPLRVCQIFLKTEIKPFNFFFRRKEFNLHILFYFWWFCFIFGKLKYLRFGRSCPVDFIKWVSCSA